MKSKQRFVSYTKYYNVYYALHILYIFAYIRSFKFLKIKLNEYPQFIHYILFYFIQFFQFQIFSNFQHTYNNSNMTNFFTLLYENSIVSFKWITCYPDPPISFHSCVLSLSIENTSVESHWFSNTIRDIPINAKTSTKSSNYLQTRIRRYEEKVLSTRQRARERDQKQTVNYQVGTLSQFSRRSIANSLDV